MTKRKTAPRPQRHHMVILAGIFGVFGVLMLLATQAATGDVHSFQAETGTLNNTTVMTGGGASGSYVTVGGSATPGGPLAFTQTTISGGNSGDCKALGDFDDDGDLDGAVGGEESMYIYKNPGSQSSDWTVFNAADAGDQWTTDCAVADMDGDGDMDIVSMDIGIGVFVIKNPGNSTAFSAGWDKQNIGSAGWVHDVDIADFNGDNKPDIVTRNGGGGSTDVYIQGSGSYSHQSVSNLGGEGVSVGDVDTDGDEDIMAGGYWLENNGSGGGWAQHTIVDNDWGSTAIGDINKDGKNDVVYAAMEDSGSGLTWYSSTNPTGSWTGHEIDGSFANGVHDFEIGDLDGDGWLDIVIGRMSSHQPSYINAYKNNNGTSWTKVEMTSDGVHNIAIGDVDDDGDVDAFGSNYGGGNPIHLWRNTSR